MHEEPRGRAWREKGEIEPVGGWRDRNKTFDFGPAHEKLHADPGPERDARDPAGSRLGIDRLRPVQGRRCVRELPLAVVKIALREADSAKVKAKDRESTLGKSVVKIVDNLIVHRPAELR